MVGTSHTSYKKSEANIKHRISYSSAFSLESYQEIEENRTFNAVNNKKSSPGQVLGSKNYVKPAALFPSIITLRSVTWKEFLWSLKTILSTHKYGAETRTGGDVRNRVVGIVAGWEELISSLELSLELAEQAEINFESIGGVLESYQDTIDYRKEQEE
ncbi:MAG: type I-D CRISPR-associated protein Cas7/Csc2 [Halanaerobiales bacterium]